MKVYDEKHLKNIVLLGAPKSGKTLLAEDMLFEAGIIHRRGTIEGNKLLGQLRSISLPGSAGNYDDILCHMISIASP